MAQPFNYALGVESPMEARQAAYQNQLRTLAAESQLQGAMAQSVLQQQEAQRKAELEQQRQEAFSRLSDPSATAMDYRNAALLGNEAQGKLIMEMAAQADAETKRAMVNKLAPTVFALQIGKTDRAIGLLEQQAKAMEGNDAAVAEINSRIAAIKQDPQAAFQELAGTLSLIDSTALDNMFKLSKERRETKESEVKVRKESALATTAEAEAKYANQQQIAQLQQKAAEIGLSKAQTRQALAQTSNLTEQGRILALDFKAAAQGLPIPSKGGGTKPAAAATEDERKAAGWLAQADNAYRNMLSAMYTKEGKKTGAEIPGVWESVTPMGFGAGVSRSTNRQKFVQGSESLGEAILRAATGAGVNKDEAAQKARELTPVWSDDAATREQKLAAIPMYLKSLQTRAGRAAPEGYEVPVAPGAQRNVAVDY